jgi:glyoxylase-like metal-dependent hydrolase (beta-lactamase superfamily II)
LVTAVDRVGPWRHLVLLTTHGHVDHVGNNDLVDQLARERGVSVEHFVPALDVPQMVDPHGYWSRSFGQLNGIVPMPAPPKLVASKVVSLFKPMQPFGRTTRSYEDLPPERISIGSLRLTGWTFADGAVRVIRSQGHCAGHVMVQLRDSRLLHMSDEANGPCGVMADADQLKIVAALGAAVTLIEEEQVTQLTDGHSFVVARAPEALDRLRTMLDQAVTLQDGARAAIEGKPSVDAGEFAGVYGKQLAQLGVGGANPNPLFTAMMALNTLRELGLRPGSSKKSSWARPDLNVHSISGPRRIIGGIGTVVSFVGWRIRGKST